MTVALPESGVVFAWDGHHYRVRPAQYGEYPLWAEVWVPVWESFGGPIGIEETAPVALIAQALVQFHGNSNDAAH